MLIYRIEDDTGEGPFIRTKPELLKSVCLNNHFSFTDIQMDSIGDNYFHPNRDNQQYTVVNSEVVKPSDYFYCFDSLQNLYNYFTFHVDYIDESYYICKYCSDSIINIYCTEFIFHKKSSILIDKHPVNLEKFKPKPIVQNLYTNKNNLNYSSESFIKMLGAD